MASSRHDEDEDGERSLKRQRTLGQSGLIPDDLRLSNLWGADDINPLHGGIDQDNPIQPFMSLGGDFPAPVFLESAGGAGHGLPPASLFSSEPMFSQPTGRALDVYPPSTSSSSSSSSSSSQSPFLSSTSPLPSPRPTSAPSEDPFLQSSSSDPNSMTLPPSAWDEALLKEKIGELEVVSRNYQENTRMLRSLQRRLKQAQIPLSSDHKHGLLELFHQVQAQIQACMASLDQLLNETFLQPQDIHKAINLRRDLEISLLQLRLYQDEFNYLQQLGVVSTPSDFPTVAFLVLAKCPFPKAIKKETKAASRIEEPTVVRLLQAARVTIKEGAEVVANQVPDEPSELNAAPVTLTQCKLDAQGYAYFDTLKFNKATRSKLTRLVFHAEVDIMFDCGTLGVISSRFQVSSYSQSPPFIVFANESQWEPSEAKLIKKSIFDDCPSGAVSFFRVANYLQIHFLRGTRQDPSNPHQYRCLALRDMRYFSNLVLKSKCFPNLRCIQRSEFDVFWDWFGQVFRKIRHTPNLGKLWGSGLISFMSRTEAEGYLQQHDPGHFLVRFSETVPKGLVITSRQGPHMEHYLVSVKEKSPLKAVDVLLEKLQYQPKYQSVLIMHKCFFSIPAGSTPTYYVVGAKDANFGSLYRTPDVDQTPEARRYDRS